MRHCILQVSLIFHLVGTDQDPVLGIEAACFPIGATSTVDIVIVKIASELSDVIAEKADDGTCSGK